ncbi:MAG: transglutaminase-like domain-containing protein [Candidatus Latescibacter sp.]|nr:transglutaminase-like domain-containing protein [Candidatus Latescibacter sp.]
MIRRSKINLILLISAVVWLMVMGRIYMVHYVKKGDPELGYFSSDVKFDSETKQYFSVYKDGRKIGYKTETQFSYPNLKIFREETVLKMYESGISREIFIQSTTGIDSATLAAKLINCRIQSGSHVYLFNGEVKGDSLLIDVKKNNESPWRRGYFPVDGTITSGAALPYIMHRMADDTLTVSLFDPVVFMPCMVGITRLGKDFQLIGGKRYNLDRYMLDFGKRKVYAWLDSTGKSVKSEGMHLFGEGVGAFTVEKSLDRNLFMLPVVSALGKDVVDSMKVYPDRDIPNPRRLNYLKIELDGIRAANIDVSSSNKEVVSLNPVIFGIYRSPLKREGNMFAKPASEVKDTTVVGISDYIQSKDARIIRAAKNIVKAETDTLAMARAINRWVFTLMRKDPGIHISRSIDILRNMKGGWDEHTKLFTALSRSIGIPARINIGLVYDNASFRYHSWPSVFTNGAWHDFDPWFGQDEADASHVTLIQGDFERLVELMRLSNRISIKVLEYR